jgi:ATP-dependent Clp protease ATP-binding subunit ClpX
MTDIMYEIPSRDDVQKCIVSKEVIDGEAEPRLILEGESEDGEDETA